MPNRTPPDPFAVPLDATTKRAGGPPSRFGQRGRIVIADSDPCCGTAIAESLRQRGFDPVLAPPDGDLPQRLDDRCAGDESGPLVAVVIELEPSAIAQPAGLGSTTSAISELRRRRPALAIVAVSPFGSIEEAVAAMRAGADDYLVKPIVDLEVELALQRAIERRNLLGAGGRPSGAARPGAADAALGAIVGSDPRMREVLELAHSVGATSATVLMTGESGTGKSLIARAIHELSDRAAAPFVELACGSIPETLLESELFGHVRGAFTGAIADKRGRFLAAHGGTIFLDEINSASPAMQLKLLRVLQERRFEAVGSDETLEVDVRVILASNQPLERLVAEGRFRQDLYYRIAVVPIELPPLRERPGDIPTLAETFLARFAARHRRPIAGFDRGALDRLVSYAFPGNVRELENIVERAVILARGHLVQVADLPPPPPRPETPSRNRVAPTYGDHSGEGSEPPTLDAAVAASKRQILLEALRAHGWNRTRTAAALGIDRTTLYKQMRTLGLQVRGGVPGVAATGTE